MRFLSAVLFVAKWTSFSLTTSAGLEALGVNSHFKNQCHGKTDPSTSVINGTILDLWTGLSS